MIKDSMSLNESPMGAVAAQQKGPMTPDRGRGFGDPIPPRSGAGRGGKSDPRERPLPYIITLPDGTTYSPFTDPDSIYFDPSMMIPGSDPYVPPYMRPGFVPTPFDPYSPYWRGPLFFGM